MKRATIIVLSLLTFTTFAQNLVKNGSLENTGECPIVSADLEDFMEPWEVYVGSPDYFHTNCGFPGTASTTNNATPFDGSGFVGMAVYGDTGAYEREYLHGELKEELVAGKFYRITFYVKPVTNNSDNIGYGINNIGAFLSQQPLDSVPTDNIYGITPQVYAKSPIIGESHWTAVCGIYKAKGGEKYITLGNFFTDLQTQTIALSNANNPSKAYYLFDFLEVVENDMPQLPADTILCVEERIDLRLDAPDINVRWSDGSVGPNFVVTTPGTYYATISDPACSYTDTLEVLPANCDECKVYVPNAFTPNGDGRNDLFEVKASCVKHPTEVYFLSYHINIFDRWGQKVFESYSPEVSWDGKNVDGQGVYTYNIEYKFKLYRRTQTLTKRGVLTLIR